MHKTVTFVLSIYTKIQKIDKNNWFIWCKIVESKVYRRLIVPKESEE